jgi:hypothetical protein
LSSGLGEGINLRSPAARKKPRMLSVRGGPPQVQVGVLARPPLLWLLSPSLLKSVEPCRTLLRRWGRSIFQYWAACRAPRALLQWPQSLHPRFGKQAGPILAGCREQKGGVPQGPIRCVRVRCNFAFCPNRSIPILIYSTEDDLDTEHFETPTDTNYSHSFTCLWILNLLSTILLKVLASDIF